VRDNQTSTEYLVRWIVRADNDERLVPFNAYDSHIT
jgi:hypothetical protein